MTWNPPFTVLTSGDGHFLGTVYCECTEEQWHATEFKKTCPVHGEPRQHRDPFITQLRAKQEKPEVSDVRGIDVEQATQEAMNL